MALLEVRDLTVRFGGVVALDRVSFAVEEGQVVALIGPNGAGKTTLFNIISRVYRPAGGTVAVGGVQVLKMTPHEVIRQGVARTFQNLALFRSMTVLDNVLVGDHIKTRSRWLESTVPMPSALNADQDVVEHRHRAEEREVLKSPRHALPDDLVRRHLEHLRTADRDGASRGFIDAGDDVEKGGLAGAVGPDERDDLAFLDRERDPIE